MKEVKPLPRLPPSLKREAPATGCFYWVTGQIGVMVRGGRPRRAVILSAVGPVPPTPSKPKTRPIRPSGHNVLIKGG